MPEANKKPSHAVAEDILRATERLLTRYGYRKMTVEDIARAAGIGKGTIYLHFRSKEEIVVALINRMVEEAFSELRRLAGKEDLSAGKRIGQMLRARVLKRVSLFRGFATSLYDLLADIRPALVTQRGRQLEEEARIFADVVRQGVESGEFHKVPAQTTAHALLDATNSFLPYYLSPRQLGAPAQLERQISAVAKLVLAGLGPSAPALGVARPLKRSVRDRRQLPLARS